MTGRGISFALLVLLGVGLIGYGLFEARKLLQGPEITIDYPADGSATSSASVVIAGIAQNISFLTINDSPAYADESGNFSETLTPPPGYTVLTVAATDRFGRRISRSVTINVLTYCPA
ncbi:MAG: hypothetical protein V4474_02700 [Patescibacteria group bacterium]